MSIVAVLSSLSLDNGLARTPPLGWRSWNAYGGGVTQEKMEAAMGAMVDDSRGVSLHALGYTFAGLDDGWQHCGAGVNGSFHAADGTPIVDESKFPSMKAMVSKAHALGLKAGWYLNNCICSERDFSGPFVDTVVQQSVKALVDYDFDGLKLDSCSQFNNLTRWNELINATSAKPVLLENCHQGGLAPGAKQWQTYIKQSTPDQYEHRLGYLSAGSDVEDPLLNSSFNVCEARCTGSTACLGISFEADEAMPTMPIPKCYLKSAVHFVPYDASNARCAFDGSPNDCPYNFFRTSGDINARWSSMLGNLETTLRYRTEPPLSRPGTWAYPDMMEVGRLENVSEDRAHFAAWAISSSPLILGHDLADKEITDRVWPIITNKGVISINQAWAGSPGTRIARTSDWQVWTKPLGGEQHALLVLSNASSPINVSIPLVNISKSLEHATVTARDVYTGTDLGTLHTSNFTARAILPHDSTLVVLKCVSPRGSRVKPAASEEW